MPSTARRVTRRDDERVPVVVGAGQAVDRDGTAGAIELAERAAAAALAEAPGLAAAVDRLTVVALLSPAPPAPAGYLAQRLRLTPAACELGTVGGDSPAVLLTRAAADIAAGRLRATLIVGAEASWSPRERPRPPGDSGPGRAPDTVVGTERDGISPVERAVRLGLPAHVYPMFDSVRAARAGVDLATHRRRLGELLAPFTHVAAAHPYAWFRTPRGAGELAEPGESNRITAEPYTKLMNAFPAVCQGAAVLVCSLAEARRAGVADGAVYVWSGGRAADVWFPVARPDLGASPGLRAAVTGALAAAGDPPLDRLDLYSCFPSAVQAGVDVLGAGLPLTVTGGLPYFGGPGNNYATHALATMAGLLRAAGGVGLVTAVGWYLTKHAAVVLGAEPPPAGFTVADTAAAQRDIDAGARPVSAEPTGPATVAASTVVYDRSDGSVRRVFGYLDCADGARAAAVAHDADAAACAGRNLVGERVVVGGSPPTFRLA